LRLLNISTSIHLPVIVVRLSLIGVCHIWTPQQRAIKLWLLLAAIFLRVHLVLEEIGETIVGLLRLIQYAMFERHQGLWKRVLHVRI
jgi:hypothetical protein